MKQMRQKMMAEVAAAVLAIVVAHVNAQQISSQRQAAAKRVVVVSLEDRKLALLEDGAVKKIYTVAIGKPSTPSPVGTFTIQSHVANPTYSHDGQVIPSGPQNPVGSRWMGLSIRGYGIHGTNAPNSIGKAASHGCIRMGKADVEELFSLVKVGDTVELIGTRNEQTAQVFGVPAVAPQPSQGVTLVAAHNTATTLNTGSM